jgi:type VI secretion system protein
VRESTLLDRLRDPHSGTARRAGEDLGAIEESIKRHLQRMLNSRQGCSLSVPDYGTPDISEVVRGSPEVIGRMEESIRRSIELYEPRLADASVRFVGSEDQALVLCFEVNARLVRTEQEASVSFTTKMVPEGRVDVVG